NSDGAPADGFDVGGPQGPFPRPSGPQKVCGEWLLVLVLRGGVLQQPGDGEGSARQALVWRLLGRGEAAKRTGSELCRRVSGTGSGVMSASPSPSRRSRKSSPTTSRMGRTGCSPER